MQGCRHFLLLGLGLCLVASYVNSADIKLYGNDPNNPYEDVTKQLEIQRAEKQKLETLLEKTENLKQRGRIQKDLDKTTSAIAKMEVSFRVLYKDHIEAIAGKNQDFENEKAKMQNELKEVEKQYAKAVADMNAANQKDKQETSAYQAQLEDLAKQLENTQREYAALKEMQIEKEEKAKEEKEQLIKVRNELTKKLEEAKRMQSKAIEVMSMSLESPVGEAATIPLESEIKDWKKTLAGLSKLKNRATKLEALRRTQNIMKVFYDQLYEKSELSNEASHEDLKEALAVMKMNTKATRNKLAAQRNAFLEKLKQKTLGDYSEEEINQLKKISEDLLASDLFLQEISRRKAYLQSIKEIDSLMKSCAKEAKKA